MCYNIKVYLEEISKPTEKDQTSNGYEELPPEVKAELMDTLTRCKEDWKNFISTPSTLFDQLGGL